MSQRIQRLYWRHNLTQSDSFYLLDGARVISDGNPGLVFEHYLIKQNMPILELSSKHFYGLPVNEILQFSVDSTDYGLSPFLEIRFFKKSEEIATFVEKQKKSIEFVVPDYDDFVVRLRVSGSGFTRLFGITGRVMSTGGLIFEGDRKLSENLAVLQVEGEGTEDSLLVSFSDGLYYLSAEFFKESKPQCHFASLNGTFDINEVLDFLLMIPYQKMRVHGATEEMLSNLAKYATITTIE